MPSNPNQKSRTRDNNGTLTIRQNMKHITVNALRSFIGLWIMTNIRFFPEIKLKFSDYSGHSDLLSNAEMSQGYFGTREAPIITWWLCANKLAEYVAMTFHRSQDSPVWSMFCTFDTLRLRQNGCHFPDDIFRWIFLNENFYISITISLKFVPKGPINNIPALVQIMAWRHPGNKPLSEPMMVCSTTHICVTRPQWVNTQRLRQNGCHFAEDNFKCISLNENFWILNWISLKYVP